mmetsp:Transcript_73272/g.224144  ORF Transcript_73272/g.224144 Transcript_73272/m.224144 type:complete len:158 (+) Transcript_73272:468-941(+)
MQLTILLMLATTLLQGCLPSFYCCGEGWGWAGMALLMVCRALQGLSAGGELSCAAVYISEISPKRSLGLNLSWISVSGAFGAWTVAALVVSLIESLLSKEDMLMWGTSGGACPAPCSSSAGATSRKPRTSRRSWPPRPTRRRPRSSKAPRRRPPASP